uniref:Fucosyltransferase n=1 Tax=Oryza glumipatula TaxID=40148 RepID=A0A0D9ZLG0_9ORYZ
MSPRVRMSVARWLPSSPAHGKTKSRRSSSAVRPTLLVIAVTVIAVLLVAVVFGGAGRWTLSGGGDTSWVSAGARVVINAVSGQQRDGDDPVAAAVEPRNDRLLGGLLSPDFDDSSCLSRYRAGLYRRQSPHAVSPHLVASLRRYESIHRRCGPGTSAYERAVERLRSPPPSNTSDAECRYLVWTPLEGLGNRMLTLTSAFLYALLTDRVLLFHHPAGEGLRDLFCEPFPGSTWTLPEGDFPFSGMQGFNARTRESLGNALRRGEGAAKDHPPPPPPWMYVHLRHDYNRNANDPRFFCDDGQDALRRVGWVVLLSDNYFVPGLFLVPRFERALSRMLPRRDAAFHHLGRYLLHPSNTVWGMVARYHASYMACADERVGIQVRSFYWARISTDELYGQIMSCAHGENILPRVTQQGPNFTAAGDQPQPAARPGRRKAVLVVSLHGAYSERIKDLYYEHGAAGGESVSVFQPTHLDRQRSGEQLHNQKALAEMMLLSFSDVVVTSAASTFGYVGHGLAGLRPWVLMSPLDKKVPDPPCRLAATIEPCFHNPPNYDCRTRAKGDTGKIVRHIRHCEDFENGVQLVD